MQKRRGFAGVVTTGIYCRPTCRVKPPRPENVRWFASRAAAEAAGFRPCRRCRPEVAVAARGAGTRPAKRRATSR